jgi:hypothetical protein
MHASIESEFRLGQWEGTPKEHYTFVTGMTWKPSCAAVFSTEAQLIS